MTLSSKNITIPPPHLFVLDQAVVVDHVYTLGRVIHGRKDADLITDCFFLDVQEAYDMVRRNELWKKLWGTEIRGKMSRMMKKMTECAKFAVMLFQ